MKFLRITDLGKDITERETYKLLEKLNTFTFIDCKNTCRLSISENSDILVLEHFDQSSNPTLLLQKISTSNHEIKAVILIDSDPEFNPPFFSHLDFSIHVVFNAHQNGSSTHKSLAQKRQLLLEHLHQVKEFAA